MKLLATIDKNPCLNKLLCAHVAIALMAIAVLDGCAERNEAARSVRPALAYTISNNAGSGAEVCPGEIRARREADHAFRISGKMVTRFVEQGNVVKRGQALAQLDPQDVKLAADSARANVTAATTEATFADAEYNRFKDLFNKGFVSQSALDQKLNVATSAKARLEAARAQASVSSNQAGYATLTAEQDGVVTQVMTEAGQVVAAGQAVMRIADPAAKELSISAPESRIAEFRRIGAKGSPVRDLRVATWAHPDQYYPAKVREVSGAADPLTRTYSIRLTIQGADDLVQLGMSAFAVFIGANDAETISVPLSALYLKNGGAEPVTGVWQIGKDGKVSLKPVTVIQYKENAALIKGGVKIGDMIVAAGVHKLREGEVVKPITDPRVTGDGKVAAAPDDAAASLPRVAKNTFDH
ncbi:MAG: efflux RND transporter periplasmic adaptor subunit [Betaproteobacteria bacterium]|nr:efflux RND transporter periplasmic adaptor subunit [Betaproteobacteria bacterium]